MKKVRLEIVHNWYPWEPVSDRSRQAPDSAPILILKGIE